MKKVILKWQGGDEFAPASPEYAMERLSPKFLMLYAAAECAAHTVMMLLEKSNIMIHEFEITCSGELSETAIPPQSVFTAISYSFNITSLESSNHQRIMRIVTLVQNKYCGMVRMMRMIAPVSFDIAIHTHAKESIMA